MTAPDSRDSVERVVAEMRKRAAACSSAATAPIASFLTATADRLQALARGPQQAGGEEVARLRRERDIFKAADESMQEAHYQALTRALAAEAVLREEKKND